jgi:hypothetical protein
LMIEKYADVLADDRSRLRDSEGYARICAELGTHTCTSWGALSEV